MSRVVVFAKKGAQWVGLAGSILTMLIGCIHVFHSGAALDWPDQDVPFLTDTAKTIWRDKLFSLRPDVFVESWTPLVTGVCGVLCHVVQFPRLHCITKSYFNYFWFLMFQGLFATISYCGGLGILFGIPVFTSALLAFIGLLFDEGDASLKFNWKLGGGGGKHPPQDDLFMGANRHV
ncbi:putative transmembrane protein [Gregarina niphandrodes]|uniref:Transmembrane protein n=1 Tax=Gregarina niphandrodes TaxID=110365 RepID=A0A023BCX8_GRENI|nr:putative transmembrane protein [Gregarina niphandrodes]EZG86781.1 putative transmembrane protein [Gregarina niphandrodes]|eukprot:XP_011128737.1 putative transmembrane protein [Gregarina niphandrodes]